MKNLLRFALAPLLLLGSHCAAPAQQVTVETSAPSRPGWLERVPTKTASELFVVGSARDIPSIDGARAGAQASAAEQVAAMIGVRVSSDFQAVSSTADGESAQEKLAAKTHGLIRDLAPRHEYFEKTTRTAGKYREEFYHLWVLYALPTQALGEERERQNREQRAAAASADDWTRQAEQAENKGDWLTALTAWQSAAHALTDVPADTPAPQPARSTASALSSFVTVRTAALRDRCNAAFVAAADGIDMQAAEAIVAQRLTAAQKSQRRDARYQIRVRASTQPVPQLLFGQTGFLGRAHAELFDGWAQAIVGATDAEQKGFARVPEQAQSEASKLAIQKALDALLEQFPVSK